MLNLKNDFIHNLTPLATLRMPAPVFFDCWDLPLLFTLRESDMGDMNVKDGWGIYLAVAYS